MGNVFVFRDFLLIRLKLLLPFKIFIRISLPRYIYSSLKLRSDFALNLHTNVGNVNVTFYSGRERICAFREPIRRARLACSHFRGVAEGYRLPSRHFFIFLIHATPTGRRTSFRARENVTAFPHRVPTPRRPAEDPMRIKCDDYMILAGNRRRG